MPFSLGNLSRRDIAVLPLEAADSKAIAELQGGDFARPWTDGEFAELLKQDAVFGFAAREEGRGSEPPVGFVLARHAADEAEILTISVSNDQRRRGIGRMLMDAVLQRLHADRARSLFLEVDEINTAALALYRRLGFRQVGSRPNYYEHRSMGRSAALVMRRDLR